MDAPHRPSLLVVEDDERLRYLLTEAAERAGVFGLVEAAGDGQAALEHIWARLARHEPAPDLVLSDLSMPRLDGIHLIAELKRHAGTKEIPVAIITSSNRPNDREDATAAGCSAFFRKPARLDEMIALLRTLPRLCTEADATAPRSGL